MIAPRRTLSVLVPDPELARDLPQLSCIRRFSDPDKGPPDMSTYVFVVVSLLELPNVAAFTREANQRHYLRGVFVRDDLKSQLLPQILQRANLRTVNSLVVHSDPAVPGRVLRAFCMGAEDSLLADARVIDDRLFLISASGETLEVLMDEHPALRKIPRGDRHRFEVASDGAYVHWPTSDIHLDLQDARVFLDPKERERVRARTAQETGRFGRAVAAQRRRYGLRQKDIPGLSERQVRRYERGARVPLSSLRLLARAHGKDLDTYLDEVAALA